MNSNRHSYVCKRYPTLVLHPHWAQLFITQLPAIILCCILAMGAVLDWLNARTAFLAAGAIILICLLGYIIYMSRIKYIVTDEQVIYLHGVIRRDTDFMELYRIVDYQEKRTFMQQVAGLKNVVVFSMDRNTPVLTLLGIRESVNLIAAIRQRVESNKERKGVYEITNRM